MIRRTAALLALLGAGLESLSAQEPSVSFQPMLVPIEITWSPSGGWAAAVKASLATPLGTVTTSLSMPLARQAYPGKRLLIIQLKKATYVYELADRSIDLSLPRNHKGEIRVHYDGRDIQISVPDPEHLAARKWASRPTAFRATVATASITIPHVPRKYGANTVGGFVEMQREYMSRVNAGANGRKYSWWELYRLNRSGKTGWLYVTADPPDARLVKDYLFEQKGDLHRDPHIYLDLPAKLEVPAGNKTEVWVVKNGCVQEWVQPVVGIGETVPVHLVLRCDAPGFHYHP